MDLVVLVPGRDDSETIEGLLRRSKSLGISEIEFKTVIASQRDPGCFGRGHEILSIYRNRARFALVVFDHEGSGQEQRPPAEVRQQVLENFQRSGWAKDRVDVVVVVPELERWVWSASPNVPKALGWEGNLASLRAYLQRRGHWRQNEPKPHRPKEAVEAILRKTKTPRSSSIYRELARTVGLTKCQDEAFAQLLSTLARWFPRT